MSLDLTLSDFRAAQTLLSGHILRKFADDCYCERWQYHTKNSLVAHYIILIVIYAIV